MRGASRFLLVFILFAAVSNAEPHTAGIQNLPEAEFRALAQELSGKVNLFRDFWAADPGAEFFAGTTRDYLYWLKGQFRDAQNPEEAQAIVKRLRALLTIDVRDFIIGESDVDVAASRVSLLDPAAYGIRKFDRINPERFTPGNRAYSDEIDQGFIPVEKIRLGKDGFIPWDGLGDGVGEIYRGKPTLHAPDPVKFPQTSFVRQGKNHEILLAIRYVRILAMNYFQEHGKAFPGPDLIFGIDPESSGILQKCVLAALEPGALRKQFGQPKFVEWLNASIKKAFRSYTNPTATMELFRFFGIDRFVERNGGRVEPINQYLFAAPPRDDAAIEMRLAALGSNPAKFYSRTEKIFPNGTLYHGSKTEEAFRGILLQGVLPSGVGSGGAGLYGVDSSNIKFAETWGGGGRDRVVTFPVKPSAKIVDVTQGEGKRVYRLWVRGGKPHYNAFAEEFGIDILRYPYTTRAYVVKNSAALEAPSGLTRQVLSYSRAMDRALEAKTFRELGELASSLAVSGLSTLEIRHILSEAPIFSSPRFAKFQGANLEEVGATAFLLGNDEKRAFEALDKMHPGKEFLERLDPDDETVEQLDRWANTVLGKRRGLEMFLSRFRILAWGAVSTPPPILGNLDGFIFSLVEYGIKRLMQKRAAKRFRSDLHCLVRMRELN